MATSSTAGKAGWVSEAQLTDACPTRASTFRICAFVPTPQSLSRTPPTGFVPRDKQGFTAKCTKGSASQARSSSRNRACMRGERRAAAGDLNALRPHAPHAPSLFSELGGESFAAERQTTKDASLLKNRSKMIMVSLSALKKSGAARAVPTTPLSAARLNIILFASFSSEKEEAFL